MCSCLGFRRWSPVGEAVLMSSPWWTAGGRPHGSFFFFFFHPPLCVCVFACVEMEGGGCETQVQQGGEGRGLGRGGGPADVAEGGFLVPLPTLCSPPADPLRLTGGLLLSSQERDGWVGGGSESCRGCSFAVKPGASASVRKGIWRAWWKPPCYLARVRRGESHASLTT